MKYQEDFENVRFLLTIYQELRLVREPNNPEDKRAIAVYYEDKRIGYVRKEDNKVLAGLMDIGFDLIAKVCKISNTFTSFDIDIFIKKGMN